MGSEYHRKFEEMKKYIPFLESMIKRLESNSSSSNPRQAQLDKIRSLRDLLIDPKKRMKMDNLLKCEQVLVNLYAKVEQRDTIPLIKIEKPDFHAVDSSDLETVRNKLKSVVKSQNTTDTLPEIARASEREEICEPGSKEPALFQRRPNRSLSPLNPSPRKLFESNLRSPRQAQSKRYTRVLVSPEPQQPSWPTNEESNPEKLLFSRRSPKKTSPTYHKRERKKSSKSKEKKSRKDLNITLKVPEESLQSLNTDDILSRIITCSDGDVDIDTLRELRTQILGELKQTGSNDDISELILKSYNKKSKIKKKKKRVVEEGEISDSESEVIENVYGSLVVMDKDKKHIKAVDKSNQQRKIQICLVINAEKESDSKPQTEMDLTETGVFGNNIKDLVKIDSDTSPSPNKKKVNVSVSSNHNTTDINTQIRNNSSNSDMSDGDFDNLNNSVTPTNNKDFPSQSQITPPKNEDYSIKSAMDPNKNEDSPSKIKIAYTKNEDSPSEIEIAPTKDENTPIEIQITPNEINSPSNPKMFDSLSPQKVEIDSKLSEPAKNTANFYIQPKDVDEQANDREKKPSEKSPKTEEETDLADAKENKSNESKADDTEIPLLNEPHLPPKAKKDVVSEIDILQALKNEILSETIAIAPTEADTPALHQPKVTKVAPGTETSSAASQSKSTSSKTCSVPITKKRISIENYKKKSETVAKSLFARKRSNAVREEMKKQSLKLTEKECERFNLPARFLDDDEDDISDDDLLDDDKPLSLDDIYANLAPKSPDQETFYDDIDIPVLIPTDPVKTPVVTSKGDVDMRSLPSTMVGLTNVVPTGGLNMSINNQMMESKKNTPEESRKTPVDPRLRRELSQSNFVGAPTTQLTQIPSLLGLPPSVYTPNYIPSMTPVRTPNPRSFEMTPTHQSFDVEEPSIKHIYAPSFSSSYNPEREFSVGKDWPVWEPNKTPANDDPRSRRDRNPRWESIDRTKDGSVQVDSQLNYNPRHDPFFIDRRDSYSKQECPSTPGPSFEWSDGSGTPGTSCGRLEAPITPIHHFGRSDCPSTPVHPFGRSDCPSTPSHPFGRSECPPTPSHPFGRSDCPPTPSHPFGRSECPPTPSHPFGRSDCPPTPSHPFGRSECPPTPSHPFGRSDCPPTPSHPFGRSECPPTPSHPFGRSECPSTPSHPFGRESLSTPSHPFGTSDYKDPRLIRRQPDYESRSTHDEKDRGYQNDRSFNRSNSNRSHSRQYSEDSSRNSDRGQHGRSNRYSNERYRYSKSTLPYQSRHFERERSIGRSNRNYSDEPSGRNNGKTRCEPSQNRSLSREDSNSLFTRNRDRYDDFRGTQMEANIDRAMPEQNRLSRARSIGRTDCENSLSIEPQEGRAFTIDTSVNATFQKFLDSGKGIQVFDYTNESRRQRATSVGRSLVRENSGALPQKVKADHSSLVDRKKRAGSVGRSLVQDKSSKTFTEIKADFKSFQLDSSKITTKVANDDNKMSKEKNIKNKDNNFSSSSRRKDEFQNSKPQYSPSKNYRDPRMRKDQKDSRNKNDTDNNSLDRRHSGIVYSNANIAKGTIMGSGFGVKNYKIPKLIRPEPVRPITPVEEPEKVKTPTLKIDSGKKTDKANKSDKDEEFVKSSTPKINTSKKLTQETSSDKKELNSDDIKVKNKQIKGKINLKAITSDDDSDFRVTRSSKKLVVKTTKKKRRIKNIVEDSDSQTETDSNIENITIKNEEKSDESNTITKANISKVAKTKHNIDLQEPGISKRNRETNEPTNKKVTPDTKDIRNTLEEDSLDSSFGIDDLEMFPDNIVSDPVIDSINNLIADLDKDLGASKSANNNFSTEMDKIMGAIDNQEENTLGDISELIEKDLSERNEKVKQRLNDNNGRKIELTSNPHITDIPLVVATNMPESKKDAPIPRTENDSTSITIQLSDDGVKKLSDNDEIVSTTQTQSSGENLIIEDINKMDQNIQVIPVNAQSVPDSTIVQNMDSTNKPEESLPDSTMEIHSEVSSDVTSTLNDTEKSSKETAEHSSSRKRVSDMESFGSLLSILQDKSKIKELLSMLGEQSGDSEKIKKKLEKLSAIVSDEEDGDENNDEQNRAFETKTHEEVLAKTKYIAVESKVAVKVSENRRETIQTENAGEVMKDDDKTYESKNKEVASILEAKENITKEKKADISNSELQNKDSHDDDDKKDDHLNDDHDPTENTDKDVDDKAEKTTPKKGKLRGRGKGRTKKGKFAKRNTWKKAQSTGKLQKFKPKTQNLKTSRELQTLQNDIKEMFICNDVLNATGIRNCRLAKMIDKTVEKPSPPKDEPIVLLEKCKHMGSVEETVKKIRKRPAPKPKSKIESEPITAKKSIDKEGKVDKSKSYKPGPKSKTRQMQETDPYEFDTDSIVTNTTKETDANSSDSEIESDVSSSSESSTVLAEIIKKPKKKRGAWKTGYIKPKHKKKNYQNSANTSLTKQSSQLSTTTIPDLNCFTDKMYCFQRGVLTYDCRLCHYSGTEIVSHYKKQHAHTEVPLSRMNPATAKKAIMQCEQVNFQAISKIPSEKYTCRFCYKEFSTTKVALETFFWHVVSTHTGEYKHLCYECVNDTRCPFNLDIPPPPKEVKGQLIGYICGKCNFTQISLENLKTHVIVRHNDEQTEVFTINLGVMTQKAMKAILRTSLADDAAVKPRTLRSSRTNLSIAEGSDDRSEMSGSDMMSETSSTVPKIEEPDPHMDAALAVIKLKSKSGLLKSKLRFETDDREQSDETSVKREVAESEADYQNDISMDARFNEAETLDETHKEPSELDKTNKEAETVQLRQTFNATVQDTNPTHETNSKADLAPRVTSDIFKQPHFKLNYKDTGAKEYICCVNGEQNHYKTTLLISLKKHVQSKHSENWDGYCCVCKVIVTLQGVHSSFKDCLTHFLEKHLDDFPVMDKVVENTKENSMSSVRFSIDASTIERTESPKSYIAVRPLSDLISTKVDLPKILDSELPFAVIDSVVSLGDKRQTVDVPQISPVYPSISAEVQPEPIKPFQYEEFQAEVMSKKYRIVLDIMMVKEVLVRVFKCAGHFCSFTSDSAEDALVHAAAHKQLGGKGALDCAYCNFDAAGNAIDLVMHVFKAHGRCQFSCMLCFYRATSDQLVGAHFANAHGGSTIATKVLRATTARKPVDGDPTIMLTREKAVPYYICHHGEGNCKFKTYAPAKFCEHLQQKHANAVSHPCNLCEVTTATPTELVKHLKDHGLKLYQCTWCVHGANTEAEMLSHAATLHPANNPQAYLRIITNKDGCPDLRVLPLIYLNKLKVPVEDVIPSKANEHPTKEAERCIELEKLIRLTSVVGETRKCTKPVETPLEIKPSADIIEESEEITDFENIIEKSILTSPQKQHNPNEPCTIATKTETIDPLSASQKWDQIVCLDSDEEETVEIPKTPKDTVIDLSDEEPVNKSAPVAEKTKNLEPKLNKLPIGILYKCPECSQVFRSKGGFRRHITVCCAGVTTLRCPHHPCKLVLSDITHLLNHYKDHNASNIPKKHYICGICRAVWSNLGAIKKHLKDFHNVTKFSVKSRMEDDGSCTFTVNGEEKPAPREVPKRKTSVEALKKFGIEDIDKLPLNPILDTLVYCSICEFSTKVRLNMVRHLQLHAERQPVPQTAPVNPVPHLETNEMHFDRMVNLASSSAATRAESRPPPIALETVTRYPKYVPDRQRHTCGAKGCSYISVDEDMLRIHWDTLHPGAVDYHCVHCPPHQQLDTSKSLTATRIIAHLKMHDASLYACSACAYYYHKRQIVEKHITDVHKDRAQVHLVREEGVAANPGNPPAGVSGVGTMDLKPWQCGLCSFKSMLRQSVVEHCSKHYSTKMQYKCSYCPFRTSAIENISKHQLNAHPSRPEDVFYYYYREGTVPDDPDGTPRWQRQKKGAGVQEKDNVKTEQEPDHTPVQPMSKTMLDLNLVKREVDEDVDMSVEELCKKFGQFCEPNGITFKCPLCKTATEYTREAMQSHLYEELKYRRWSCTICPYKAYHRTGLNEHMTSEHEHSRNVSEPSELPVNKNIEQWVSELLNHQSAAIEKNKTTSHIDKSLGVQNRAGVSPKPIDNPTPGPSRLVKPPNPPPVSSDSELELAFGVLGAPLDDRYCCPKCNLWVQDETEMRNHLESELTKIRWCCTKCTDKFATFHEAQFHCKSHPGPLSGPKEAIRDASLRSAWVSAVINTQKQSMKPELVQSQSHNIDMSDTSENSLLVVRYEEPISTEELSRHAAQKPQREEESRKRPADSDDSDFDSMVIYEPDRKKRHQQDKKITDNRDCPFCDFVSRSTQYKLCMKDHLLRHYNLGVLTCCYCDFNGSRVLMRRHLNVEHPDKPANWKQTEIPNCLPSQYKLKWKNEKKPDKKVKDDKRPKKVCLHCEAAVPTDELHTHIHGNKITEYGDKGEVVVKCCICLTLRPNDEAMQAHYKELHSDITNLNYAYYKLQIDTREVHSCGICNRRFTFLRDLRIHHTTSHGAYNFSYTTVPFQPDEDDHESRKRKIEEEELTAKRIAKKSTSKLPNLISIAKKSTTKLPLLADSYSDAETNSSNYESQLAFDKYKNVQTKPMPNAVEVDVDMDVQNLGGQLNPKVVVKDIKKI